MLCDAGVRTSVCVIVRKHSSLSVVASFERRWTSARIRHRPSSPRALNALYVGSRLLLSVVASFERLCGRRVDFRYIDWLKNFTSLCYYMFHTGEWLWTNFSRNLCCKLFNKYALFCYFIELLLLQYLEKEENRIMPFKLWSISLTTFLTCN